MFDKMPFHDIILSTGRKGDFMKIYLGAIKSCNNSAITKEIKYKRCYKVRRFISYTILGVSIVCILKSKVEDVIKQYNLQRDLKYILENPIDSKENTIVLISTVNVQNKYFQEDMDTQSGCNLVVSFAEQGVDIIGIQEIKRQTANELENQLNPMGYSIYGDLRWGNGLFGTILDCANEAGSIVCNGNTYYQETIGLPWLPHSVDECIEGIKEGSIMRRIVTREIVAVENIGYIYVYNIHADYGVEKIQKRQYTAILDIIDTDQKQLNLPIIITGDFNAEFDSGNMQYLLAELNNRDISMVSIDGITFKGKMNDGMVIEEPKQLDYIFLSNEFVPLDYQIIDNPSSDHNAILVKAMYQ